MKAILTMFFSTFNVDLEINEETKTQLERKSYSLANNILYAADNVKFIQVVIENETEKTNYTRPQFGKNGTCLDENNIFKSF
jgi:hypothetical protein